MDEQKAVSEAQKRAHRKYMEKFVEIKVRVTPEKRTAIQEHAQAMGESATTFINRAIDNQIAQDGARTAPESTGAGGVVSLPSETEKAGETAQDGKEGGTA